MKSVYVATSLLNAEQAKSIISKFHSNNVRVTHDWTKHGQVFDEKSLIECGIAELNGVKEADLLFMMHPARSGSHVELGIALGCNKPVVLVYNPGAELKTFYFVPNVFRFLSIEEAFSFALERLSHDGISV